MGGEIARLHIELPLEQLVRDCPGEYRSLQLVQPLVCLLLALGVKVVVQGFDRLAHVLHPRGSLHRGAGAWSGKDEGKGGKVVDCAQQSLLEGECGSDPRDQAVLSRARKRPEPRKLNN